MGMLVWVCHGHCTHLLRASSALRAASIYCKYLLVRFGLCIQFSIWCEFTQVLCMLTQPLRVHVCISPVVFERYSFLGVMPLLYLLQAFGLLFHRGP